MNTKKCLQSQTKILNHRRTALSLLIGGLFCAATPAWADCNKGDPTDNGGFNITCEGDQIEFDKSLVSNGQYNNVTINGIITKDESNYESSIVYGGYIQEGTNDVTFNTVSLTEGSEANNVYGGYTQEGTGNVTSNRVILTNSSAKMVFGGDGYGTVKQNEVSLNNSSVDWVYGGSGRDSEGNKVTLTDSSATYVIGGRVDYRGSDEKVVSNNNIVSINGDSKINEGGRVYGAVVSYESGTNGPTEYDIVTGNIFKFNKLEKGTNNISVAEMGNFERYEVYLQESGENYFQKNGTKDKALITVTSKFGNQLAANQDPDLAKANLWIERQAFDKEEFHNVEVGDKFYILSMAPEDGKEIQYVNGTTLGENLVINPVNPTDGREGLKAGHTIFNVGKVYFVDANVVLDDEEGSVYIQIEDSTETEEETTDPENPDKPGTGEGTGGNSGSGGNNGGGPLQVDKHALDRVSPVLDSKIAALSVLNSGNDLSRDILIGIEPTQKGEIIAFGKVAGEHNKAKGTSDIRINGVNALVGSGVSLSDETIVGGYFEYGYGHYDSTRDFDSYKNGTSEFNAMHYKGQGNVNYEGVGALIKSYANDNLYFNGGVKLGTIKTNYSSTSFTDYDYRTSNMDYSKSKLYFGAQIGIGLKSQLTENSQLNSSINFIYSHIGGNSFELDESHIKLNKVKSERLVLNEEYKYYFNEDLGLKLSGTFDYEFSSIAEGTIDDHTMTNSSLRGGTVIFGAGILLTPFEDRNNQYFDLSVNASAGKNQSVGGSLTFNYKF